MNYIKR